MSKKTYTWEQIERAVGMWDHRLRMMDPGSDPFGPSGLDALRDELDAKPHWVVVSGVRASDPLGQRVDVYWSSQAKPVLSLKCLEYYDARITAIDTLRHFLDHWFPLGPASLSCEIPWRTTFVSKLADAE